MGFSSTGRPGIDRRRDDQLREGARTAAAVLRGREANPTTGNGRSMDDDPEYSVLFRRGSGEVGGGGGEGGGDGDRKLREYKNDG